MICGEVIRILKDALAQIDAPVIEPYAEDKHCNFQSKGERNCIGFRVGYGILR